LGLSAALKQFCGVSRNAYAKKMLINGTQVENKRGSAVHPTKIVEIYPSDIEIY